MNQAKKDYYKKRVVDTPKYALLNLWVLFTFFLIGWIVVASFSTTPAIFSGTITSSGFHPGGNYLKALVNHKVGLYFLNSLLYTVIACTGALLIAAPAAYVLARYKFRFNKVIQAMFVAALSIPAVMLVIPLFGLATRLQLTNTRFF